jgi:hypothetical protein
MLKDQGRHHSDWPVTQSNFESKPSKLNPEETNPVPTEYEVLMGSRPVRTFEGEKNRLYQPEFKPRVLRPMAYSLSSLFDVTSSVYFKNCDLETGRN